MWSATLLFVGTIRELLTEMFIKMKLNQSSTALIISIWSENLAPKYSQWAECVVFSNTASTTITNVGIVVQCFSAMILFQNYNVLLTKISNCSRNSLIYSPHFHFLMLSKNYLGTYQIIKKNLFEPVCQE